MLSSLLLGHRHRCASVVALTLTLGACGDDDPTAPIIPLPATASELAGTWTFADSSLLISSVEQTTCRHRGILRFTAGTANTIAELRLVGTCISPRGPASETTTMEGTTVTVAGDSVVFTLSRSRESCTYRGRLTGDGHLRAHGSASCSIGRTGTWEMKWGLTDAPRMGKLSMIDVGTNQSCALEVSGRVFCWGSNSWGELGTGDDLPHLVAAEVTGGIRFTQISVSDEGNFVCGLTGTGKGYCWGNSWGGRLGDGSGPEGGKAVMVPQSVVGGHTFKQIAAAGSHTCAITTAGRAYCWGYNEEGQLGTGNRTPSSTPVEVTGGLTFKQIDTYVFVSCGVTIDGDAYCWGNGEEGALGNGTDVDTDVPTLVKGGLKFVAVSVGYWSGCGVTTSGEAYCWGWDSGGNLGTGAPLTDLQLTPARVTGGLKWKSVRTAIGVTCGISVDNRGFCWGWGLLGAGAAVKGATYQPIAIAGSQAFDHLVPILHTCGLTVAGVAYCWGYGGYGAIGDGDLESRWEPVKVAGQP